MNAWRVILAGVVAVALSLGGWAGEKQDKAKLLVGTWEVAKIDKNAPLAIGTIVEFSTDGKTKTIARKNGETSVKEGVWKFERGKLIVTIKSGQSVSENLIDIKKISASELVMLMVESGSVMEFRRKK